MGLNTIPQGQVVSSGLWPAPSHAVWVTLSQNRLSCDCLSCGLTCAVFSSLSFFPPFPLWLYWVPCSEATPTAGTVPAAEVMGVAWDSAGGGQPGGQTEGEAWGESMLSACTLSAGRKPDSAGACGGGAGPEANKRLPLPSLTKAAAWKGAHSEAPDLLAGAAAFSGAEWLPPLSTWSLAQLAISEHRRPRALG